MYGRSRSRRASCPGCGRISTRTHGWYIRRPQDVPSSDRGVKLVLTVRRFCCDNTHCKQRTFAERLARWLPRHAQRTGRLTTLIRRVGFEVSAESGRRLLSYMRVRTSGDTLLRVVKTTPLPPQRVVRRVGLDDWAVRKGERYGSVLVDHDTHQVVALVPGRSGDDIMPWLRAHPEIELVTRDRSPDYRKALTEAAPQAVQVTDRFHLLVNLRQLAYRVCMAAHARLRLLPDPPMPQIAVPMLARSPSRQREREATRQRRLDLYNEVQRLKQAGISVSKVGMHLHINYDTARTYYQAETFPERSSGRTPHSLLKPHLDYLEMRYIQGYTTAATLFAELLARGYQGKTRTPLNRWLKAKRLLAGEDPVAVYTDLPVTNHASLPSSYRLSWLLVLSPERLDDEGRRFLAHLCKDALIAHLYHLAQAFRHLLHVRSLSLLDIWLDEARVSPLAPVRTFAASLRDDLAAIRAAVSLPWSNGQTEGQVNRIKFIKRQMFGRASFDLLRRKVLYQPGST